MEVCLAYSKCPINLNHYYYFCYYCYMLGFVQQDSNHKYKYIEIFCLSKVLRAQLDLQLPLDVSLMTWQLLICRPYSDIMFFQ